MKLYLPPILLAVAYAEWDGPSCMNPLYVGEIHSAHEMDHCIDSSQGVHTVTWYECNMMDHMQWVWCQDGTIRNQHSHYCMKFEMSDSQITGDVYSQPCEFDIDENPHDVNLWTMKSQEMHEDPFGIQQMMFVMAPAKHDDWCLTWDSTGVKLRHCNDEWEQFWFYKDFGEVLAWGRIVNVELDTQTITVQRREGEEWGKGQVICYPPVADAMDRVWVYYENGQIVNQQSYWCLDIMHFDGGIESPRMFASRCKYIDDTRWVTTHQQNGEKFTLVNKMLEGTANQKCAAPEDNDPDDAFMHALPCEWIPAQYWTWDENISWTEPEGKWMQVGCNESGGVKLEVSVSTEYSKSVTKEVSTEVATKISAGFKFAETEVTSTVASSTAKSFSSSYSLSTTVTYDCQFYQDNSKWQGGCMWQFSLDTEKDGDSLTWNSNIVKCTRGLDAPKCPPFMQCTNNECSKCQASTENIPVKSSPRPARNGPLPPLPRTTKTVNMRSPPKPISKTWEDYREKTKCSALKEEGDCNARGDCKVKSKGRALGKCKALSCRRIKHHMDCVHANKKCRAKYKGSVYKKCVQERKHD